MATNKKIVYKGNTYFFDADGKMLTGWVTADGDDVVNEENGIDKDHTYYADETGARVEGEWIYTVEPSTAEDDADADYYYYYLLSSGKVASGKRNNIKGQTYLFDDQYRMLSGWVRGKVGSDGKTVYESIDDEDSSVVIESDSSENYTYYYCGGSDDGHVKKDKWIKTWRPADTYEEDEDVDQFWYWIESDGKIFVPSNSDADKVAAEKWKLEDGELVIKANYESVTKKKINSKDYFFNENGEMLSQFLYVLEDSKDLKEGLYYFGGSDDGSMKTGAETIKDDNLDSFKFYFETKGENKGVGITGNKSNKLYYMGHLVAAQDYRYQLVTIDVKEKVKVEGKDDEYEYVINEYTFIVNSNGTIQHSTVEYKEDGDVLIDASELSKTDFVSSGTYKYALQPGVVLPTNVEYLDPTQVMAVGSSVADAVESADNAENPVADDTTGNEQN